MQSNITPENVGLLSQFMKDFGFWQTVLFISIILGLYGGWKWINIKTKLFGEGKENQILELSKQLERQKEANTRTTAEYMNRLESITSNINKDIHTSSNFQEADLHDLTLHPFFSNLHYWINVKVPQTNIKNKTKRNVFIDYMTIKFSLQRKMMLTYVSKKDISRHSISELQTDLLNLNTQYSIELHKHVEKYKLPAISIEKFRDVWNIYDSLYVSFIESVLNAPTFETNHDKLYTIFDSLLNINEVLLLDFVTKIDSLNGELEDSNYISKITQIRKEYE